MFILPETELVKINKNKDEKDQATFVIEPLLPGYGMTLGNALRRVLLSSLSGDAITSVKIEGANHEFSTIKGIKEDIVELIINLKGVRVILHGNEAVLLKLSKKGPGVAKAGDFVKNSQVEIIDPEFKIATLDKNTKFEMEVKIEHGRGYVPTEKRGEEKLPLGTIAIDSIFTPIKKIHYEVEHTRVGGMTNFDKLTISIATDGTITPDESLEKATKIILDHFNIIDQHMSQAKQKPAKISKIKVKTTPKARPNATAKIAKVDKKRVKPIKKVKK